MASPAVEATATTSNIGPTASTNVLLPATVSANAVLIAILRTTVLGGHGWPAGWTELVDSAADASDDQCSIAYKNTYAAGTEDGTTVNVTHAASSKGAAISLSITGAADPATTPPAISTVATGTSATPDPTSVTIPGGPRDCRVIWMGGWEGEQTTIPPTGDPTNYTGRVGISTGTAGGVATNAQVAISSRALTAASSEDPPSWTIQLSDDWMAWAVAVVAPAVTATSLLGKRKSRQLAMRDFDEWSLTGWLS